MQDAAPVMGDDNAAVVVRQQMVRYKHVVNRFLQIHQVNALFRFGVVDSRVKQVFDLTRSVNHQPLIGDVRPGASLVLLIRLAWQNLMIPAVWNHSGTVLLADGV